MQSIELISMLEVLVAYVLYIFETVQILTPKSYLLMFIILTHSIGLTGKPSGACPGMLHTFTS